MVDAVFGCNDVYHIYAIDKNSLIYFAVNLNV